jgi:hypothetical protein
LEDCNTGLNCCNSSCHEECIKQWEDHVNYQNLTFRHLGKLSACPHRCDAKPVE